FSFLSLTPPTALSPLSLHDALPIPRHHRGNAWIGVYVPRRVLETPADHPQRDGLFRAVDDTAVQAGRQPHAALEIFSDVSPAVRSEEHTSELQSLTKLVCRLLLEKK